MVTVMLNILCGVTVNENGSCGVTVMKNVFVWCNNNIG